MITSVWKKQKLKQKPEMHWMNQVMGSRSIVTLAVENSFWLKQNMKMAPLHNVRPFYSVPAFVGTFISSLKPFRVWVEVVKWLSPSNLPVNSTEFHTLCCKQATLYSPAHLWKVSVKWTSLIVSVAGKFRDFSSTFDTQIYVTSSTLSHIFSF